MGDWLNPVFAPPNLNKADVRFIRSRYALFPVISKIDHLEILEAF